MSDTSPPRHDGDDSGGTPPVPPPPPPPPPGSFGLPADAQSTQAYGSPGDDQPTLAYPKAAPGDADDQPTLAYAPAAYPAGQQYSGGSGAGQTPSNYASAAAPQYAGGPGAPGTSDGRPRGLAIAAIIAAALGLLLCLGGFVPVPGVATVLTVIGGVLLLAGLILAIVVLVSKKQGGKGLGVAALIMSVLGGILFAVAFFVSLIWAGLAAAGREEVDLPVAPDSSASALPSEEASETPSASPSEPATPDASGTYDEAAYLAAVRPAIVGIMQEIQPDLTEEQVNEVYTDDVLVSIGQSLAAVDGISDGSRQVAIDTLVSSSGGVLSQDQATRFYDAIANAAQQYLQE